MTLHIGIDPGLEGYACAIDSTPDIQPRFWPTPIQEDDFDIAQMVALANEWHRVLNPQLVVIEEQRAFPGKGARCFACGKPRHQQGVSSTFETGKGWGAWVAALYASSNPVKIVKAQEWKGPLGLDVDKAKSVAKAKALAPDVDFRPFERVTRSRVADHNKCEAFLLAVTARRLAKREGMHE